MTSGQGASMMSASLQEIINSFSKHAFAPGLKFSIFCWSYGHNHTASHFFCSMINVSVSRCSTCYVYNVPCFGRETLSNPFFFLLFFCVCICMCDPRSTMSSPSCSPPFLRQWAFVEPKAHWFGYPGRPASPRDIHTRKAVFYQLSHLPRP